MSRRHQGTRRGFTLIELIVVVVVLGILAAVAAPKFTNQADQARENAAKQTLAVVRNALELHRTENGGYPAAAGVAAAVEVYIRGDFPGPGIGTKAAATGVFATTADPPTAAAGAATDGWLYNAATGNIWINDVTTDSDGATYMSY